MLKSRTLGPEHLENQTQLRRSIRVGSLASQFDKMILSFWKALRDRIQKMEAHLQASKRKLAEAISGKPSLRHVYP